MRPSAFAVASLLLACGEPGDGHLATQAQLECDSVLPLQFVPELLESEQEAYLCFAFDASQLEGSFIRAVHWKDAQGASVLHHAKLYATSELRPSHGRFDCDPMPSDA